jgi:hypothetical protein
MKGFSIIFLLLLLNNCANAPVGWGGKYEIIQSNSKSITIKYDTILGQNAIFKPASDHCEKYNRSAVPTLKTTQSLGIALQTFECK